ncbi:GGDEF domain-containing protein [Thiolinea disciformis]|uniref:GGDEF domain-containing protein n=1 Tax=Thiolinea disciformis TaxID=125614 RepID=UPI00037B656F|nr:diguanylate cyclase [Thiolinea disciformis]
MNKHNRISAYFDLLPDQVVQEQMKVLLSYGVVYFWMQVLSGTLLTAILWFSQPISRWTMGIWYLSVVAISALRWLQSGKIFTENPLTPERLHQLTQNYLLHTTLLNALWGLSSILFYVPETTNLALHIVLLSLIAVSIFPLIVLSRNALHAQIAAVFIPMILVLFTQDNLSFNLLAISLGVLAGLMALSGHVLFATLSTLHHAQIRLLDQMNTDPLTQVANRRYFEQVFKLEWRRAARNAEPLSLLMIDVDHFKSFNDQFGHQAGDKCLKLIARNLQSLAKRASDVVARHGGEEFVILLPNTTLEDALNVAESLRAHIEKQPLSLDPKGHKPITISIGVSSCVPSTMRTDELANQSAEREVIFPAMLLRAADQALYHAKHRGRNQVAHEACGLDDSDLEEHEPALGQAA